MNKVNPAMPNDFSEFRLSNQAKTHIKNKEKLKQDLSQGKIVQEILEFTDLTMSKFYKAAYTLFEQKSYLDASHAFLFLATLNPHIYDYWLGLGMATQLCKNYETAIDAYELAALCDIASPVPYFYLAKCLFAIHDRVSAIQALDLAIDMAADSDEYVELKHQAKKAREILLEHDQ